MDIRIVFMSLNAVSFFTYFFLRCALGFLISMDWSLQSIAQLLGCIFFTLVYGTLLNLLFTLFFDDC